MVSGGSVKISNFYRIFSVENEIKRPATLSTTSGVSSDGRLRRCFL